MGENLELYFDEGGDFSIGNDPTDLLIISAVAAEMSDVLLYKLSILEAILNDIGFSGAIHTAPLVRRGKPYAEMELKQRRAIFWSLYNFARTSDLSLTNFILDKRRLSSHEEVYFWADEAISGLYKDITTHRGDSYPKIFYDGGQRPLMQIIYGHTERCLSPEQYYADFDHETNRIFQVADLMTYITRLVYKRRNSIPLNKSDRLFFTGDNLNLLDRDTILKTTP